MKDLRSKIQDAQTTKDLENALKSVPLQENGHKQGIARLLEDAFWYIDLDTVDKQKQFMLERL